MLTPFATAISFFSSFFASYYYNSVFPSISVSLQSLYFPFLSPTPPYLPFFLLLPLLPQSLGRCRGPLFATVTAADSLKPSRCRRYGVAAIVVAALLLAPCFASPPRCRRYRCCVAATIAATVSLSPRRMVAAVILAVLSRRCRDAVSSS
jgi:hypothetical protein